ncbi:MAG: PucR family transcriptional regulator, partial [Pseudomonadota bacterium]
AEELGYKEKIARIPIIIKLDPSEDIATIQENIKNAEGHSKQDISLIMGDNHILVFKTLPGDSIINYKDTVKDYIKNIDNKLKSKGNTPGNYYVGTPQHEFELYRQGFHHANWMEMNKSKANSDALFFMDFISDYFRDSLPFDIFDNIFSSYLKVLDQFGESVFVETAGALLENNMNIINTSQKLFLHRNTVTFRLNKIKDILGIDPVNSMSDREFLSHMLYFINNK